MLKNLLLIDRAVRILFLSETHSGRVHDQRMADTTSYPLPVGSQLLQDLGFQAFTLDGVDIIQPTKKPRGHKLTRAQKAAKRKIARVACASHMSTAASNTAACAKRPFVCGKPGFATW
jgi:hypothetical protein